MPTLEQYEAQFAEVRDAVAETVAGLIGDENPGIVLVAQWGEMGAEGNDLPNCLMATNIHPCSLPGMAEDVREYAEFAHAAAHDAESGSEAETVETATAEVPD